MYTYGRGQWFWALCENIKITWMIGWNQLENSSITSEWIRKKAKNKTKLAHRFGLCWKMFVSICIKKEARARDGILIFRMFEMLVYVVLSVLFFFSFIFPISISLHHCVSSTFSTMCVRVLCYMFCGLCSAINEMWTHDFEFMQCFCCVTLCSTLTFFSPKSASIDGYFLYLSSSRLLVLVLIFRKYRTNLHKMRVAASINCWS